MTEILAALIEKSTDLKASITVNLASESIIYSTIKSGEMDLFLAYAGPVLMNLGAEPMTDPIKMLEVVKEEFDEQHGIMCLDPYGFNNTYAMMVTRKAADKYNLATVSDMAKVASKLTLGCAHAFTERADELPGLAERYDFSFGNTENIG